MGSTDAPTADAPTAHGEYRRWEGVTLAGTVLYSTRPLSATRLNDAAVDVVDALGTGTFRSPESVASETGSDAERVGPLLERLHRRGFLEWRPARDPDHRPPVSVVVTVRDARDHLRACLDALADLDYPAYEVVVVDDGSTDGTDDVAATHPLAETGRLRTLSVGTAEQPLGVGASRNRGVDAAAHDVVAFTDADCRPRPEWLADLVPCLAAHDLVGGRVRPAGDAAASAYEAVNSSLDMGPHASRVDPGGDTPYLATANLVGRRTAFQYLRFPERDVAEDVEVCWRALDAGLDVVYSPRGVVDHAYRAGVRRFAARRSAYGASEALLARLHGRTDDGSVAVPVAALVALVLVLAGLASSGLASTGAFAVAAALAGARAVLGGRRLWRRLGALPPGVSGTDLARSRAREALSAAYALAREVTRYYALPLVGLAVALGALGAALGPPGVSTVGVAASLGVGAAVLLALLVEYRVHDPDVSVTGYAVYYLADHLGYQRGVYRGAFTHRTVAHVHPAARFRLAGPGAPTLGRLLPGPGDPETRRVDVGGVTARFRVDSPADRWWFEDATLAGERPVVADLLGRLRPDDVFWDVGANAGLYGCLAGRCLPEGSVVAFEPHPRTAGRLAANLDANGLDAQVLRTALGARAGQASLRTPVDDPSDGRHTLVAADSGAGVADGGRPAEPDRLPADDSASAGPGEDAHPSPPVETRQVPVATGDALVAAGEVPGPTVVKVDVEGAEADALAGLDATLRRDACRLVYCELHPAALDRRDGSPAAVVATLRDCGFAVETVQRMPDGRSVVRAQRAEHGDCDARP